MDWLPNFNQSNIVIALRAALAAAAILYVLEIYDIKNGMGHLGFLAVVLSCFAKPSALGDIFPFALLLIKGLIVTVPLMTGFVVFMRGQDQKSRSAFNFALPIVTFVGSFFITWTPWVPRPTRPVQCRHAQERGRRPQFTPPLPAGARGDDPREERRVSST